MKTHHKQTTERNKQQHVRFITDSALKLTIEIVLPKQLIT